MMKITRVGVDIGKNTFHACAVTRQGEVVWRKVFKRVTWIDQLTKLVGPEVDIGMEACGGAHHWARTLQQKGHLVRLIAPQFVKPYVQSNKTDNADAEAIAEVMSRPRTRFVPVKTVAQQDIQALHRVRADLIKRRTAKASQIRGLVAENGLVASENLGHLRRAIAVWLEDAENGLSFMFRQLLSGMQDDLQKIDARLVDLDKQMKILAKQDATANRLMQLRGVGPVNATALAAALGDGKAFRNGRDFAVSLGLTPRQHSTGGKETILGISKRGDGYLRKQLVHGARSVIHYAKDKDDSLSQWINKLSDRRHANVATVALAAKTARMAWALVNNDTDYNEALAAG